MDKDERIAQLESAMKTLLKLHQIALDRARQAEEIVLRLGGRLVFGPVNESSD